LLTLGIKPETTPQLVDFPHLPADALRVSPSHESDVGNPATGTPLGSTVLPDALRDPCRRRWSGTRSDRSRWWLGDGPAGVGVFRRFFRVLDAAEMDNESGIGRLEGLASQETVQRREYPGLAARDIRLGGPVHQPHDVRGAFREHLQHLGQPDR